MRMLSGFSAVFIKFVGTPAMSTAVDSCVKCIGCTVKGKRIHHEQAVEWTVLVLCTAKHCTACICIVSISELSII